MGQVFISRITSIVVIEEEDAERVRLTDAHAGHRRVGLARLHQQVLVGEREVEARVDVVAGARRLCGEERGAAYTSRSECGACYPLCRFESVLLVIDQGWTTMSSWRRGLIVQKLNAFLLQCRRRSCRWRTASSRRARDGVAVGVEVRILPRVVAQHADEGRRSCRRACSGSKVPSILAGSSTAKLVKRVAGAVVVEDELVVLVPAVDGLLDVGIVGRVGRQRIADGAGVAAPRCADEPSILAMLAMSA